MSKVSFMTCFIKVKISSAVGSLLFFSNPLKNFSHFWLYSLDFSAVATVAGRPWQVNKIIGCLQVFQGILFLPSVAHTVVSRLLLLAVVEMTSLRFYVLVIPNRREESLFAVLEIPRRCALSG